MEPTESPLLDDESMEVLAVLYRARVTSVVELRPKLDPTLLERLDASLEALQQAGFIVRQADRLVVDSPYATFVALSKHRIEEIEAETRRTVAMMDALPVLIRNWDLGEAEQEGEHPLSARLLHGLETRWEFWRNHLVRERPIRPSWVLPDMNLLRELYAGRAEELSEALTEARVVPRFLVRPDVLADPENRELVGASEQWGVEVRVLEDLPGWFYTDSVAVAALPVTWGEERPSTIMVTRTPPVVGALGVLFDLLWNRSEPASPRDSGWQPVLAMLAQGLTDEAIGRTLGHDVRTVRRRIAEAMEEFGVSSRFALGVAWAARVDSVD